jgi:hypothetical protein
LLLSARHSSESPHWLCVRVPQFECCLHPWVVHLQLAFALFLVIWALTLPDRGVWRSIAEGGVYFGALSCFAIYRRWQLHYVFASVITALVVAIFTGLRMVMLAEVILLALLLIRPYLIAKRNVLLLLIPSVIAFSIFGFVRFGPSTLVTLYDSGDIYSRIFMNNFSGSVVSSLIILDAMVHNEVVYELSTVMAFVLPIPTSSLPEYFYTPSNLQIPGGGATVIFSTLGYGLAWLLLTASLCCLRRYFSVQQSLRNIIGVLILLGSVRIALYAPIVLTTYIAYALCLSFVALKKAHLRGGLYAEDRRS